MKLFIRFLIFIVILGIAGPFIMKSPDGRPYMDYRKFVPSFSSIRTSVKQMWNKIGTSTPADEEISPESSDVSTFGKTRVYQWQDENGVWQYSDTPPNGKETQTIWLNPNENIVPGAPIPAAPISTEPEEDNTAQETGFELPLPLTISPSEVPQLIEDAKQVKELMQKRNEMLESASGESLQ